MNPITFVEPTDLGGALAALAHEPSARIIAGGSDLLAQLKDGRVEYGYLISLDGLDALRGIEMDSAGLRIGALTRLVDLERSPALTGPYRVLAEAARSVATPEIRNQGTLGGNLCQRPRCLHYRHALVSCLKKGGEGCPAAATPYQDYLSVFGGAGCYAVAPSELAPPLIALDATVILESPRGRREMALESFFVGPDADPTRENVLADDEIVSAVSLPPIPTVPSRWRASYSKARERTAGDFAVVSAAIGYELVDGRMRHVRLVLGGAAPTPLRMRAAEAVLEHAAPSDAIAAEAAETALSGATPLENNAHKLDQARALITRGLARLAAS